MTDIIITIVCTLFGSAGLWAFLSKLLDRRSLHTQMLIGLGHDRIVELGMQYISRGYITRDEYENLHDYLYKPYEKMGGNGSAKKIMQEVEKLEIR